MIKKVSRRSYSDGFSVPIGWFIFVSMPEPTISPPPTHEEFLVTVRCANSDEFLSALSPHHARYASFRPRGWIYRGVADDQKYDLTPSALRAETKLSAIAELSLETNREQCRAERRVLEKFLRISDSIGLHVPEDTQELRAMLRAEPKPGELWPPEFALSLMALAQHHGLPTRLLDWSRHPLKAAWFAAREAVDMADNEGCLSVWCLCRDELRVHGDIPLPFTIVTAPSASNSNLRAQEGVFTHTKPIRPDELKVDRRPFDEILFASILDSGIAAPGPWLYRITLPKVLAAELLFSLKIEGVTRAVLFPSFDGVAQEMQDDARLDRASDSPATRRMMNYIKGFQISYRTKLS